MRTKFGLAEIIPTERCTLKRSLEGEKKERKERKHQI